MTTVAPKPAPAMRNVGHGHVWPRPDGRKSRCGGPGVCGECSALAVQKAGAEWDRYEGIQDALNTLDKLVGLLQGRAAIPREEFAEALTATRDDLRSRLTVEEPPPPPPPADNPYNLDLRIHSRACGIVPHGHGGACHANCPTCGGRMDFEAAPRNEGSRPDGTE